jgi:hypothetical protein
MGWLASSYGKLRYFFIKGPLTKCLGKRTTEEVGEEFLELLVNALGAARFFDPVLEKSMKGFDGRIQLKNEDNEIRVLAEFKDNGLKAKELKPKEELKPSADATIVFKDYRALMNFLLPEGGRRDVLKSLLNNEVRLEGNLNFIYRFGFLANHVQLPILRELEGRNP